MEKVEKERRRKKNKRKEVSGASSDWDEAVGSLVRLAGLKEDGRWNPRTPAQPHYKYFMLY